MIIRYFTLAMMIVSASATYAMQPTDNTKATWTKPKHKKVENNNDEQRANPERRRQGARQPQRAAIDPAELNRLRRRGQLDFDDDNIEW